MTSGKFTRVGRIDGAIWTKSGDADNFYLKGADIAAGGRQLTCRQTDTELDDCDY